MTHPETPVDGPPPGEHRPEPTVVGIGASAGGLAALRAFFSKVPADCGVAFVVVVHLSPEHKSHFASVLQPYVAMPVQQVLETVALEPNRVYVIPPNANLNTIDTHLRLSELERDRHERAPIDHFFRTLANTHDGDAIGVILSGAGSDGVLGIKDIKANGGIVAVQDPNDAEYDGMPQSAIATGLADLVLPAAEIAEAVVRFANTAPRLPAKGDGDLEAADRRALLHQIFAQLRARTGRDFSRYKSSTVLRRIARRMQFRQIEDYREYIEQLQQDEGEVLTLADDLLITVTNFFRDNEVFDHIEADILPTLFRDRTAEDPLRVWSVGCATGEEAYSLTILLMEAAARYDSQSEIQVFATDLHERSLNKARQGYYLGALEADVTPKRLKRYFLKEDSGYRVRKEVRERIIFTAHNLLTDPPFSRLDLIVCRNLLIYIERDVQNDAIELFHYALKPEGFLVLGTSETVERPDLFAPLNKNLKIFKKLTTARSEPHLPVFPVMPPAPAPAPADSHSSRTAERHFGGLHQRVVELFAPPSLLVDGKNRVVHLSERAGRYLLMPGGSPNMDVLQVIRRELSGELRSLLHRSRHMQIPLRSHPIPVRFNGSSNPVVIHVRPAPWPQDEGYAAVIFDEKEVQHGENAPAKQAGGPQENTDLETSGRERQLEDELNLSGQRLQSMIEEYETGREEMRAANEELQSTNEELRSAMEELETSKEELQSMNEELQTVNLENRLKVEELAQLSSDLQNLLAATNIATLFLDRDLRILRFTPKLGAIFSVRTVDIGRPISDLTQRLGYDEMRRDAESVLQGLVPIEREMNDEAGRAYLTSVLPYRSTDDRIEGVVITFVDVTALKQTQDALQKSEAGLAEEVDALRRLWEMSRALVAANGLRTALKDVLDAAIDLLKAQYGNLQLFDPERGRLSLAVHRGFDQEFLKTFEVVTTDDDTACGRCLRMRRRVVIEDVEEDEDYKAYRGAAAKAGYRSVQSTPLMTRGGNLLGVLSTHWRKPHEIPEREEHLLDLLAQQAGDSIERIRNEEALKALAETLEERVEQRTQEVREREEQIRELASRLTMAEHEERHRIAQILHDDLQQLLYSVQLKCSGVRDASGTTLGADVAEKMDVINRWLAEAVSITQRLAVDLSPQVLDNEGLAEALQWLATQMKELHGLTVKLDAENGIKLTKAMRVILFQTARELLFNVVKHAGVHEASVELRRAGDHLLIKVRDKGKGFDVNGLGDDAGFGVMSMRHRLSLLGGDMDIASETGRGTTVSVKVPMELIQPSKA